MYELRVEVGQNGGNSFRAPRGGPNRVFVSRANLVLIFHVTQNSDFTDYLALVGDSTVDACRAPTSTWKPLNKIYGTLLLHWR